MIVTKLQGGLGNQMFQYACARSFTRMNQKVFVDLNFIKVHNISTSSFTARDFELNVFENCKTKILKSFQRKILIGNSKRYRMIRKFLFIRVQYINQEENEFINIDTKFKNIYLDGYFQSEKYFVKNRNVILNDFLFPKLDEKNNVLLKQIFEDKNSVSIHVRRGDYLKKNVSDYHGCLPLQYYIKSINALSDKFDDLTFYIFSDDNDFVESNFEFIENKIVVSGNTGINSWKDMCLMKYCKHHIIANSSFSWWGAWLSERNGITYAPKYWFNPEKVKFDIFDIIPNDWFKI